MGAPKGKVGITVTPMFDTDQKTDWFNLNCEEQVFIRFGKLTYVSQRMAAFIDSLMHNTYSKVKHRDGDEPTVEPIYEKKFNVRYEDDAEVRTQRDNARLRMENKSKDDYISKLKKRIEALEADPKKSKIEVAEAKHLLKEMEEHLGDNETDGGDDEGSGQDEEPVQTGGEDLVTEEGQEGVNEDSIPDGDQE